MKRISAIIMSLILASSMIVDVGIIKNTVYADTKASAENQGIVKEQSVYVGSGVKQTQIVSVDKDLNQHIDYCFEVDMSDPSAEILAGYKDYEYDHADKSTWGLQTVPDQIEAAEEVTGKEIVGAVNGDFYNMYTGEPIGVLIMGGKIKHQNMYDRNFFAIKKDGTPAIVPSNGDVEEGIYEEAIGGSQIVVKDGQLTSAALNCGNDTEARAAVGIKADGDVVLYTTSGVNEPVTYGYTIGDVGRIMLARGCVDALILDGGGSTTFVSKYEGEEEVVLRNNPADGCEREVSSSLLIASSKGPSEDNASLTACEKSGHKYIHSDSNITCSVCDFSSAAEGFSGLAQDKATNKWILFERGVKSVGFAPYGEDDAYYFDQTGYGSPAILVEKVDSGCTMRGYRNYKNSAGEAYKLMDVIACGHEYETVNGKSICERCGWTQVDIDDCTIKLSATKFGYTGSKRTPSIWVYTPEGKKLSIRKVNNTGDYSATVANNVEIGKATLTFAPLFYYVNLNEDRGTIIGERVVEYKILPYPAQELDIEHSNKNDIVLSWTPSKSAGYDYDIEYNIYKKEGAGKWVKIDKTADTTYAVNDLKSNTVYEFRILSTAMGKDGKYYNSWEYATAKTKTVDKLKTPAVTVKNDPKTGKNIIKWTAVKNAEAYTLYRATSQNGVYKKLITKSGTSCTHTGAVSGKLYYYKVKAILKTNEDLNSNYSKVVSRRCDMPRPTPTPSIDKKTGKPKLTWKKVSGASKYKIYRSTSQYGKYTYMGAVTKTSYINKTAKKGRTYWYKVVAVHSKYSSANSAYSLPDKVKSK